MPAGIPNAGDDRLMDEGPRLLYPGLLAMVEEIEDTTP
jgi:hypothetical protein